MKAKQSFVGYASTSMLCLAWARLPFKLKSLNFKCQKTCAIYSLFRYSNDISPGSAEISRWMAFLEKKKKLFNFLRKLDFWQHK